MLQAESLLCHAFCEKITQKARQPLRGRSSQLKPMLDRRLRRQVRKNKKMNSMKIRKIIGTDQLTQKRKDHKNWPTCRRNEGTSQLA